MSRPVDSCHTKQQLQSIRVALQTNMRTLKELFDCYRMFLFTGGTVPTTRWELAAITSYIERPFAANRITPGDAILYRHLAEAIMGVGEEVAATGPKSVRRRHSLTDTFRDLFLDIRALGHALDASVTNALMALQPSPPVSQGRPDLVEVTNADSANVHLVGAGEQRQVIATIKESAGSSSRWPTRAEEKLSMLVGLRREQGQRRQAPYRPTSDSEDRWLDDGGQSQLLLGPRPCP